MKLRPGTPQEAGVSPSGVKQIQKRAKGWVDNGTHPALAILAARKGIIFLHEAFGRLRRGSHQNRAGSVLGKVY